MCCLFACTLQPERISAARSELFEKDVCVARFVLRLSLSLQSENRDAWPLFCPRSLLSVPDDDDDNDSILEALMLPAVLHFSEFPGTFKP